MPKRPRRSGRTRRSAASARRPKLTTPTLRRCSIRLSKRQRKPMPDDTSLETRSEIVFYQGEDGRSRIQVRLDGGTVWLSQKLLAELYQVAVPTINEHLANIFDEGELDP